MEYLRRKSDCRWVVRVVVPERLREIVGQKQFERALGRDPRTAQKRAYPLIAEFQATIARAERQLELKGGNTPARSRRAFSLSEIAHAHYDEELAIDENVLDYIRQRLCEARDHSGTEIFDVPQVAMEILEFIEARAKAIHPDGWLAFVNPDLPIQMLES